MLRIAGNEKTGKDLVRPQKQILWESEGLCTEMLDARISVPTTAPERRDLTATWNLYLALSI